MDASQQGIGDSTEPWTDQSKSYPPKQREVSRATYTGGLSASPSMRDNSTGDYAQARHSGTWHGARMPSATAPGGMFERRGLLGWWLRLTAPAWPAHLPPIDERERLRKAELTGLSILAVALLLLTLLSATLTTLTTLTANLSANLSTYLTTSLDRPQLILSALAAGVGLLVASALNRAGWTRTAAYLVPSLLMMVVIVGIVWGGAGLQLATVPAYDLFVLPIFLTSLIADRRAPWVFATLAMAFILCDVVLQPHALITDGTVIAFDDMQYAMNVRGWWGLVDGPLALAFFAALFGWLGALSVESAIIRADRAEEVAALEHQAAQHQRQLEHGVRQILQTHVRVANGDFSARAPLGRDNVLWQIGFSLNHLIARMQRTSLAERDLRRTEAELRRLAAALDEAEAGNRPQWPAPSGTAADLVLVRVARTSGLGQRTPILPLPSDGQSEPSSEPQPGWRAASLIDPDVFRLGQTAVLPETLLAGHTGAPNPNTSPSIASIAAAPAMGSGKLPAPPRAPNTQPSARKSATAGPIATTPASLQLPALPHESPVLIPPLADPDAWPAWLAESGARLTGKPELIEATTYLTPSAPLTPFLAGGGAPAFSPSAQSSHQLPRISPAEPFATTMPDQSVTDASARVPWHSETRRRRSQFLGPVPDPPWMDPSGQ